MNNRDRPIPLAYLITFSCYGARLHGDERGTVNRDHNLPGTPFLPTKPGLRRYESSAMSASPYAMDGPRRLHVLSAIRGVCAAKEWRLYAAHIRENHVHLVVNAIEAPETVMNAMKSYASRRLNEAGLDGGHCKRWTRHGSTKYLWDEKAVADAAHYVLAEQGEPMVVYDCREDERGMDR